MKRIDYVAFFKCREHIAEFTASIASSTVAQTNKKSSSTSSTSVKNTSHEASGQIVSVNEPQENEHSSYVVSIEQAYLSLKIKK